MEIEWRPLNNEQIKSLKNIVSAYIPPSLPPGEFLKFSCNEIRDIDGNLINKYCDYDSNGKYTDWIDCMKDCSGGTTQPPVTTQPSQPTQPTLPVERYSCDTSGEYIDCIPDPNGNYTDYWQCYRDCASGITQPPGTTKPPIGMRYKYSGSPCPESCIEDPNGQYPDIQSCWKDHPQPPCQPSTPPTTQPPIGCKQPTHIMTVL